MSRVIPARTHYDLTVPLAIIGAGAAGLTAALVAAGRGIEPLVLERDAIPSGSTSLSAGLIPAAGTRWQRALGIEDSPASLAADIMRKAADQPDPAAVAAVTAAIGPAVEWLADTHGLDFSVITDFRYPGHSALRMHGLPTRSGQALIDRLRAAAERAGIVIMTDAHVTALHADENGTVTGLTLTRPDGTEEAIGCRDLILACNGYGGAKDLVRTHLPAMADALYFGHVGNQGDALLWGEALGAATADLSGYQGHGSVAMPAGLLITWATITEGGFQVDQSGQRFSDESHGYSEQAENVLACPGGIAWSIFDARIAAIARQFEDFRNAEAMGSILAADTIADLARVTRLPSDALRTTLAEVDAAKREGRRDRFGRDFAGVAPLSPSFCAVRVTGALFHTQGGLRVDAEARVLRPDGTKLPNLRAVGGAARGVSGANAAGYLSGNGLLTAVGLGFIAANSVAATPTTRP